MKKFLDYAICVFSVSFIIWLVASWVDINQNNNPFEENYKDYADWNFFVITDGIWD